MIEQRLQELGWTLPPPQTPVANYVRAVRTGNLLFLAGHLPVRDGQVVYRGKVGRDMDVETGYQAAQLVMLNCLATLKDELALRRTWTPRAIGRRDERPADGRRR